MGEKEKITGECKPCKIIFTTKQVDDRCPICGEHLSEVNGMETTIGTIVDVMEKKNKNGELFWKGRIDGKTYNFNKKPETDTNIEVKYTKNEWTDDDGNKNESRWVQEFKRLPDTPPEGQSTIGDQMQGFQQADKVPAADDSTMLMKKCMVDAVDILNDINQVVDEPVEWTSEDMQKIGVTLFLTRTRR